MNSQERKPPKEGAVASKGGAQEEAEQDAPICVGGLSRPYAAWTKGRPSNAQIAHWRRGALVLPSRKIPFPRSYTFRVVALRKRAKDQGGWYLNRWGK